MQYAVNQERCTGCGKCLDVCPPEAIAIKDGKAVILIECTDCGACPRVCRGAIRKLGVIKPVAAIR
jgi:MinD superfamily P-loop ATPase